MTEPNQTFRGQTVALRELSKVMHAGLFTWRMLASEVRKNGIDEPVTYTEVVSVYGEQTAYDLFDEIKNGGLPYPYKSYRRMTENLKKGENP